MTSTTSRSWTTWPARVGTAPLGAPHPPPQHPRVPPQHPHRAPGSGTRGTGTRVRGDAEVGVNARTRVYRDTSGGRVCRDACVDVRDTRVQGHARVDVRDACVQGHV